jgi:ABC-2 type transport system permease protein
VSSFRLTLVGGYISYRALFNWLRPEIYIPTMLAGPIFQILFFAYLGRFTGVRNDTFFVVGNAIQISAMSAVYAGTMAIANERQFGTLSPLLASPANRFALFVGRALPVIVNGLVVSTFGFVMSRFLLDFHPAPGSLAPLALATVISVVSCTAYGLTLGSLGMRARDVFLIANVAYYLMWLFCGINVPLAELPGWMAAIGRCLPLTHGVAAARAIVRGASVESVGRVLLVEVGVGVAWGAAAFTLFRVFELEGRRRASLETF